MQAREALKSTSLRSSFLFWLINIFYHNFIFIKNTLNTLLVRPVWIIIQLLLSLSVLKKSLTGREEGEGGEEGRGKYWG